MFPDITLTLTLKNVPEESLQLFLPFHSFLRYLCKYLLILVLRFLQERVSSSTLLSIEKGSLLNIVCLK